MHGHGFPFGGGQNAPATGFLLHYLGAFTYLEVFNRDINICTACGTVAERMTPRDYTSLF